MIPEENKEKLQKILMKEKTITQKEAMELLNLSSGQISNLIKKGKIRADEKNKPFLKSVIEYNPTPGRKRNKKQDLENPK